MYYLNEQDVDTDFERYVLKREYAAAALTGLIARANFAGGSQQLVREALDIAEKMVNTLEAERTLLKEFGDPID